MYQYHNRERRRVFEFRIVEKTIIDYFQNNPLPVKIRKSFNLNAFLDDLKTFFNEFIKTREDTVYDREL